MQNPSQNLGHKICSFAVSISCVFLFLFHPHLSVYVSHVKDFDPYLKKIENPLKDCEHDLMDKLKKKKQLPVASRGWIGRRRVTKKCYCFPWSQPWNGPTFVLKPTHPGRSSVSLDGHLTPGQPSAVLTVRAVSLLFSPQRGWVSAWHRPPGIYVYKASNDFSGQISEPPSRGMWIERHRNSCQW